MVGGVAGGMPKIFSRIRGKLVNLPHSLHTHTHTHNPIEWERAESVEKHIATHTPIYMGVL